MANNLLRFDLHCAIKSRDFDKFVLYKTKEEFAHCIADQIVEQWPEAFDGCEIMIRFRDNEEVKPCI